MLRGSTASRTFTIRADSPGETTDMCTDASAGESKWAAASAAFTVRVPSASAVVSPIAIPLTVWMYRVSPTVEPCQSTRRFGKRDA